MIQLFDEATNEPIGSIDDEQFKFMQDQLEEEGPDDDDYYLNQETLDLFEARGADSTLVALLRGALGTRQEMDIRFTPAE